MSIPFFQKNTKISFSSISNIWQPQSMEISDIFTGISEEGYCIDQTVSSIFLLISPYVTISHLLQNPLPALCLELQHRTVNVVSLNRPGFLSVFYRRQARLFFKCQREIIDFMVSHSLPNFPRFQICALQELFCFLHAAEHYILITSFPCKFFKEL